MSKRDQRLVLLFCKTDEWSKKAVAVARTVLGERVVVFSGKVGDLLPPLPVERADAILSFLSPWILPQAKLGMAPLALNFHPGSCDYPGIGCYNFALYENAALYGAVCHHMQAKVDTGTVVTEVLFPVLPEETVQSLKQRTLAVMLNIFRDVVLRITAGDELPVSSRQWTRRPFRRSELNELGRVTVDMPIAEVHRRVKAMAYPGYPGAFVEIAGYCFYADQKVQMAHS